MALVRANELALFEGGIKLSVDSFVKVSEASKNYVLKVKKWHNLDGLLNWMVCGVEARGALSSETQLDRKILEQMSKLKCVLQKTIRTMSAQYYSRFPQLCSYILSAGTFRFIYLILSSCFRDEHDQHIRSE
jgi:hypothetical protein